MSERKCVMSKGKKVNYKCLKCEKIYTSYNSMWVHLKTTHKKKMVRDKTYTIIPVKMPDTKKRSTNKHQPPLIVPQSNYIDVAAIIRIPISLGQVQILATG